MSTQMAGGWSPFNELKAEDKEVFAKGIEGFVGVKYSPLVVATQVVAGQNYAFFCNAEVVYPGAQPYPAWFICSATLKVKSVLLTLND
jgi:hypothetical protein